MHRIDRTALVSFSAEQMYALVADIEAYPEFLPWCVGAAVHSRTDEQVIASLEMQRRGIRKAFCTRNLLQPGESLVMELMSGPFSDLCGEWTFQQLGSDGTKVLLNMEFEFESRMLDALLGRYFEQTAIR